MPRKKVKRKVTKKRVTKAPVRKVASRKPAVRATGKSARYAARPRSGLARNRVGLVIKNLLLFLILFVVSVLLGSLFKGEVLDQLFWVLAILTGFVSAAFLIVLLILLFMRAFKK